MKNENQKEPKTAPEMPDKLNVAPGVRPFTKYRMIELCICGLAVVLGLLYLYADALTLAVLLPLYAVFFLAIAVLRHVDTRALGMRGFAAMLPVVCWYIMAGVVAVATIAYFVG